MKRRASATAKLSILYLRCINNIVNAIAGLPNVIFQFSI